MLSHIFLFGHRQQHGKDTCCNILEKFFKAGKTPLCRTYFAKLLKRQVSEKYNLDFSKMDDGDYKLSKPEHLGGLSVRDILIKEGCGARAIWADVWANAVYQEMLNSDATIGIVSDYRFPNEYDCFNRSFNFWAAKKHKDIVIIKPKVVRILVHRPNGIFKNDGADGELPDNDKPEFWDYMIINEDHQGWEQRLQDQLIGIMEMEKVI
jgi:hypothetical protein